MANFNDLPQAVRKRIYRMHLCFDEPVTTEQHKQMVNFKPYSGMGKCMPRLCEVSASIEREATPIYYGENHFLLECWILGSIFWTTWPRHLCLIRKLICQWDQDSNSASYMFRDIKRLKGLEELYIRVDEAEMVKKKLRSRKAHQRFAWNSAQPTPQQQLAILQFPGMAGLLKLSGIPRVEFVKKVKKDGELHGGPIPGGCLETQVAPRLMALKGTMPTPSHKREDSGFQFLSLSPELRNRIYELLLCFPGPLQPTNKPPASTGSKKSSKSSKASKSTPESALSLLAVNWQIHDEACGIFYHSNPFVFEWTTHLHCFLQSLSPPRLKAIRDLTIHYIDVKSGGIGLVDITYPLLKDLTGLRKLEVIMHGELAHKICRRWWGVTRVSMLKANPGMVPGMKVLFALRGVSDIKVRDTTLEERFESLKKDAQYPEFDAETFNACNLKVYRALEHFNTALAEAQEGNVNGKLLEDNQWQTWEELPTLQRTPRGSPELSEL